MDKANQNVVLSDDDREMLILGLTEELPSLRAKIGLSQEEISRIIGVSRQTYSSIETKKRPMSWNVFLSLLLFFEHNDKTKPILDAIGVFPESLENMFDANNRN